MSTSYTTSRDLTLRNHDQIIRDFLARARKLNPKKRKKPSQRLVLAVKRAKLTPAQTSVGRAVADYLAMFLDKGEPTFPSIEDTIAPDSGCADSTAREAVNFLEAIGFLDLRRRKGEAHEFRLGWRLQDAPTRFVDPDEITVEVLPLGGRRTTWKSAGNRRGSGRSGAPGTGGHVVTLVSTSSEGTPPNSSGDPAGNRRLVPFKERSSESPQGTHDIHTGVNETSGLASGLPEGSALVQPEPTSPRHGRSSFVAEEVPEGNEPEVDLAYLRERLGRAEDLVAASASGQPGAKQAGKDASALLAEIRSDVESTSGVSETEREDLLADVGHLEKELRA